MRSDYAFATILEEANKLVDDNGLDVINIPRKRRPEKLSDAESEPKAQVIVTSYYRPLYFEFLDFALLGLTSRFQSEDLTFLLNLEEVLLTASTDKHSKQLALHPELQVDNLDLELKMFRLNYDYKNVEEAVQLLRSLPSSTRQIFGLVLQLVVNILVSPASSATAERSFSGLRRLKTWLRSTMGQERLNAVAVCRTRQQVLDKLDCNAIAKVFI